MEFITNGLLQVITPMNFLLMFLGVFVGTVAGAIPGLTATLAISLLIPFTFGMEPIPALVLLLSIYCGGIYGGCITAILIRAPGTPGAAATLFDGYPMAQQGKAGEAIGIATISSGIGGFFSALVLIFLSQPIASFALKFSAQEYFSLSIFGLSIIFSLSKDLLKGIASGLIGICVGMVGMDAIAATPRFTLGVTRLLTGFNLLPVVIGIFAIAEVFRMAESIVNTKGDVGGKLRLLPSKETLLSLIPTWVRSSIIGTFIGILPGAGANIAAFVSYNEARRASKHPERFGQGAPEGVAATETANNAVTGGAMIPMLTLGIPGDAVTAVLLSALTIQGFAPGPLLFRDHMDIIYPIFACLLFANVILVLVGLSGTRLVAKIAMVKKELLLPGIAIFAIVGSFASSGNIFDICVAVGFGVLGYLLEKLEFETAPIILGLILGPMAERYLRQAMVLSDGDFTTFFTRPISVVLLAAAALSILSALRKQLKPKAVQAK